MEDGKASPGLTSGMIHVLSSALGNGPFRRKVSDPPCHLERPFERDGNNELPVRKKNKSNFSR